MLHRWTNFCIRNKTLKNLIGGNKFNPNHQTKTTKHTGLSAPCTAERKLKCCKHIVETTTFKSNVTNKSYTIRHKANCKSSNVLYLLECTLCRLQYIGKSETYFYLRLNNYRSEVKKDNPSPSATHFKLPGHNFDEHARFTIIEKIETPESITEKTRYIEQREDSWIRTLRTLTPQGINGSLNHPQLLTGILWTLWWTKWGQIEVLMTSPAHSLWKHTNLTSDYAKYLVKALKMHVNYSWGRHRRN